MNKPQECKTMTPLRYAGGKSKVVKKLLAPLFPENFEEFYEPFIGGGSVALFVAQMHPEKNIHINDLNEKLVNFWKALKTTPIDLVSSLHNLREEYPPHETGKAKEFLSLLLKRLYESTDPLEIATSYYALNKISFSGMTEQGSLSVSNYRKLFNHLNINKLTEINSHMKNFHIYNQHFKDFMKMPSEKDFTFLDPPYMIKSNNLYGKKGKMHKGFNHEQFYDCVINLSGKWMITYNDNEWIREKYKDFYISDAEYRYCMAFETNKNGEKRTRKKNELIITNY